MIEGRVQQRETNDESKYKLVVNKMEYKRTYILLISNKYALLFESVSPQLCYSQTRATNSFQFKLGKQMLNNDHMCHMQNSSQSLKLMKLIHEDKGTFYQGTETWKS